MRVLFFCLLVFAMQAQNPYVGHWKATFNDLDLYLEVISSAKSELNVPAQGIFGQKASHTEIVDGSLQINFLSFGATLIGQKSGEDVIEGSWDQGGSSYNITFNRQERAFVISRPQTPSEVDIPYIKRDVRLTTTKKTASLAATITKPKGDGPFPAVVLVSGSGPQDRNSELFGHKPFLVLADHLTKNGYVVIRYDERGVGQSRGTFKGNTSEDFANDAEDVFNYIKEKSYTDPKKVGIIGHSEGGLVAAIIAGRNPEVDFIVSMASPGQKGSEIMEFQIIEQYKKSGLSKDGVKKLIPLIKKAVGFAKSDKSNTDFLDELQQTSNTVFNSLNSSDKLLLGDNATKLYFSVGTSLFQPWIRNFIKTDPATYWSKVKAPVLLLNGNKDQQVQAKVNLKALKKALKEANNKSVSVKKMCKMNHLFQPTKTGNPMEYGVIDTTLDPKLLSTITKWLDKTVK